MTSPLARAAWLLLIGAAGCQASSLPPLPEVVVEVDTDLPVPLAMARLRVDLYADDGTWFESADFSRPDPRDWPVSFSVYSDEAEARRSRRVWVRLRGYLDGHVRDYRGERPHVWGAPDSEGTPGAAPRLLRGAADVTPASEPEPLLTVDRLVQVELEPDTKSRTQIVLRGACLGTSAVFGSDPAKLVEGEAESCVDREKAREKVRVLAPGPSVQSSLQGSWLSDPSCPAAGARACIPGGATILGTRDLISSIEVAAQPVRAFGIRRFWLDREEVSVARFRDALAAGFSPPVMPLSNEGPLGAKGTAACTFSAAPLDRERWALNCVEWATARAFCQLVGGDLPTEAQWEHAATVAGHASKTAYPWGNEAPDCDRAAYGRVVAGGAVGECLDKGALPPPPEDSARDVSPNAVVGLAAGLSEWVLDAPRPYADPCWLDAPLVDPRCGDPDQASDARSIRGANYVLPEMVQMTTRFLDSALAPSSPLGFRCAYAEAGL
jgi:formylglycine-generating enzyme required for sulfatase activity